MVEQNISQKIPKKERPIKINLRGKLSNGYITFQNLSKNQDLGNTLKKIQPPIR